MKVLKTVLYLFVLMLSMVSCNKDLDDITEGFIVRDSLNTEDIEYKWWVLAHRRNAKPGISLYNETTSTIELKLDLPKNLESPHALAFDGQSLWIGGNGENESIYQLNPENGAIISEIRNISTEGIAVKDDYLYYSNDKIIRKIEKNGTLVETILTQNSTYNIPDIAIADNNLYYLRYSENEPVIKMNLSSKDESPIPMSESTGTYCLTISNNEIITVSPFNEIIHFNLKSGALISTETTILEGWITAIAPYIEK